MTSYFRVDSSCYLEVHFASYEDFDLLVLDHLDRLLASSDVVAAFVDSMPCHQDLHWADLSFQEDQVDHHYPQVVHTG